MLLLFSCSGAKDALQGKKRSDNSDEFLVEKKNPLIAPPDIDELPVPLDQDEQNQIDNQEEVDIKKRKEDKSIIIFLNFIFLFIIQ